MKKVYNANSTYRLMSKVLPNDFKMVKDDKSKGYQYINSLYGIEIDDTKDYLDQAKHYLSFENFDYGLDFNYSMIEIPSIIHSGYIYGDTLPIKLTNEKEFTLGKPTRFVYNENGDIDLEYHLSGSGILGLEYMRKDREGNGVLYINSNLNSEQAIISGLYQSYILPMSDLLEPDHIKISGFNAGVHDQNYEINDSYEIIEPLTYTVLKRKYPFTKYIYLPKDGIDDNPAKRYLVDYYKPEKYYWDEYNMTYKPSVPTEATYIENGEKLYHKVALNNPSGSGVYDTEYLELEHIPISGTLKVYDLENVDDKGHAIEITQNGTLLYKYEKPDKTYVYIGYNQEIPYEEGLGEVITAQPYMETSWDYVREGDGLKDFIWTEDPSTPITNKIKIKNGISKYIVEYKYVVDNEQYCISTMNSNRYIKYNDLDYMYSAKDNYDNLIQLDAQLSIEKETRRALTFNGMDVRPGTKIDEIQLISTLYNTYDTNKTTSVNLDDFGIPGKVKIALPNIEDNYQYSFKHDFNNIEFNPINGIINTTFIGNILGEKIKFDNLGLYSYKYFPFYTGDLTEKRIFRTRFKLNSKYDSNFDIIKSTTSDYSWKISGNNGYIIISDVISEYRSNYQLLTNDIIDLIIIANGDYNDSIKQSRFEIYISINDSFFKKFELYENEYNTFEDFNSIKTEIFTNINVDLDFIYLYDEGNLIWM